MLSVLENTDLKTRAFAQLINGELVPGAGTSEVIDPGTGQVIALAPTAGDDQVHAAVGAADAAFRTWRVRPLADRRAALRRIADTVEEHADELARLLALETGKSLAMAQELEVRWGVRWVRHFAGLSLAPDVLRDDASGRFERHHEPLGVVAAIVPWNFPLFQTLYKVAPAVLAGNTVVLKPAPTTPLHALFLGELLRDLLPPGVVNILGDGGDAGPALTNHPAVRLVSFTGSTAVGRQVMASAASTIKRVVLELGGNDAAVVMPDADLDVVVPEIFSWSFAYAGQICSGIKRIYVPEALYEQFCAQFAHLAESAKLGHGLDQDATFGPIQNARQFERVKGYLAHAHADGKVIAGGTVDPRPGFFVPPTVVRDIGDDSVLVREETFGPVRSILSYSDLDDAVARANDTDYGLGNSVWGTDLAAAQSVAQRLESGTVWINSHVAAAPEVPFGGTKQSGVGAEFGVEGLMEFVDNKIVYVPHA
ncbi:aldehyde dehydrogenase family protein [Streptomyces sp. NPDC006645]|uniref:aldehyde dehydrogenase family protein n=1 Tax=unclassified Streptomyces TaxID=2593676 RepID=UPI0033A8A705